MENLNDIWNIMRRISTTPAAQRKELGPKLLDLFNNDIEAFNRLVGHDANQDILDSARSYREKIVAVKANRLRMAQGHPSSESELRINTDSNSEKGRKYAVRFLDKYDGWDAFFNVSEETEETAIQHISDIYSDLLPEEEDPKSRLDAYLKSLS